MSMVKNFLRKFVVLCGLVIVGGVTLTGCEFGDLVSAFFSSGSPEAIEVQNQKQPALDVPAPGKGLPDLPALGK